MRTDTEVRALTVRTIHNQIETTLRSHPELILIGSWRTFEPHLLISSTCKISFSDVDIVYRGSKNSLSTTKICNAVHDLFDAHQIRLTKISIRRETEYAAMPHWLEIDKNHRMELWAVRDDFMIFWTLIQLFEYKNSLLYRRRFGRIGESYYFTKFFFCFLKNVSLIKGQILPSYRKVTEAWRNMISPLIMNSLYNVKLGRSRCLPSEFISCLRAKSTINCLLSGIVLRSTATERIAEIFADSKSEEHSICDLEAILQEAGKHLYFDELKKVIEYQRTKIKWK